MMLTREQAISEFRKMWNWIADETERLQRRVEKEEYFEKFRIPVISIYCFLCEYTDEQWIKNGRVYSGCYYCPISFGTEGFFTRIMCHYANGSPYSRWRNSRDWKESAKYAREIANLPEREV